MFPWVNDWSDPQNDLRYSNDVRSMDYWTWFFFHPSAYKLMYYGMFSFLALTCSIVVWILIHYGWYVATIFPGIVGIGSLIALVKRIREYDTIKHTTFYDIHMREYK